MRWRLIIKEFGPKIQHIAGIDKIVADTLRHLPSEKINRDESNTMNDSRQANELFTFDNDEYNKVTFQLTLPLVQRYQQKELNQGNSKLKVDLKK